MHMASPGYGMFTNNNYLPNMMQQAPQQVLQSHISGQQPNNFVQPAAGAHVAGNLHNVPPGVISPEQREVNSPHYQLQQDAQNLQLVPPVVQQPPDLLPNPSSQPDVVPRRKGDGFEPKCQYLPGHENRKESRTQTNLGIPTVYQKVVPSHGAKPEVNIPATENNVYNLQQNISSAYQSMGLVNNLPYTGSFTFTAPTIATAMTSSLNTCTMMPSQLTSAITTPLCHAPGVGALWQHSVPVQMPWGDNSVRSQSRVSLFTAMDMDINHHSGIFPRNAYTINAGHQDFSVRTSDSASCPKPSCSVAPRRPKRHSDDDRLCSPGNKIFLSEEKMMERMKDLSLCHSPSDLQRSSSMHQPSWSSHIADSCFHRHSQEIKKCGLAQFREIEERLEIEDSDEETDSSTSGKGPRVKLSNDIAKSLLQPSHVLPKKILDEIRSQQCTEIVLWKPPGGFVQNVLPRSSENPQKRDETCISWSGNNGLGHSIPSSTLCTDVFTLSATSGNRISPDTTDMEMDESLQL